ncbi:MAG: hypothetical protein LBD60_01675 [Puniceicoccales bacterium]|jgi:hypothetical protein|nr:hypothetical protein [Puniceicoccales bacterium]
MKKSKIVKIFAITCGFCFSNMYASISEAFLDESSSIIYFGVAGLADNWQTMKRSFVYFAEKWREKVKKILY